MLPEIGRTVQHGYFTVIGPAVNPTSWLSDFINRLDRQVLVSYALARH
jgi:class 3 adenylate cyclase